MRRARGFTLIEILVAVAITALLAAMAFGGLNVVLDTADHTRAHQQRLHDLQIAMLLLVRDLRQAVPRPVRDGDQGEQPALRIGGVSGPALSLTRGGWDNPAGQRRSHLQRVAWALDGDRLVRRYWFHLDRPAGSEPREQRLLEGVHDLSIVALDADGQPRSEWPPQATPEQIERGEDNLALLPAGVLVRFTLDGVGEIERRVAVRP
ncbi:MAG TPA: type II secretion system protein GspJ [Chromatiales bacterium]|nr:type II secretion system protein GspJ [Chromatiales bacterium]